MFFYPNYQNVILSDLLKQKMFSYFTFPCPLLQRLTKKLDKGKFIPFKRFPKQKKQWHVSTFLEISNNIILGSRIESNLAGQIDNQYQNLQVSFAQLSVHSLLCLSE